MIRRRGSNSKHGVWVDLCTTSNAYNTCETEEEMYFSG